MWAAFKFETAVRSETKTNKSPKQYKVIGETEDRQKRVINKTTLTAGTLAQSLHALSWSPVRI